MIHYIHAIYFGIFIYIRNIYELLWENTWYILDIYFKVLRISTWLQWSLRYTIKSLENALHRLKDLNNLQDIHSFNQALIYLFMMQSNSEPSTVNYRLTVKKEKKKEKSLVHLERNASESTTPRANRSDRRIESDWRQPPATSWCGAPSHASFLDPSLMGTQVYWLSATFLQFGTWSALSTEDPQRLLK